MTEIIPAIMPDSLGDVEEKMSSVAGVVDWVQVDVMDGVFVPSTSWPYHITPIESVQDMEVGEIDLPKSSQVKYEVDLMVDDVEVEMARWANTCAERLIFHIEAIKHIDVLEHILMKYREKGRREIGVAIGVETSVDLIESILTEVDVVQCMGIAKIGYQGQPFDKRVLEQVRKLRKASPSLVISVDGGVNFDTASQLVLAGVDRLVSGSTIFDSNDIPDTISRLKSL